MEGSDGEKRGGMAGSEVGKNHDRSRGRNGRGQHGATVSRRELRREKTMEGMRWSNVEERATRTAISEARLKAKAYIEKRAQAAADRTGVKDRELKMQVPSPEYWDAMCTKLVQEDEKEQYIRCRLNREKWGARGVWEKFYQAESKRIPEIQFGGLAAEAPGEGDDGVGTKAKKYRRLCGEMPEKEAEEQLIKEETEHEARNAALVKATMMEAADNADRM